MSKEEHLLQSAIGDDSDDADDGDHDLLTRRGASAGGGSGGGTRRSESPPTATTIKAEGTALEGHGSGSLDGGEKPGVESARRFLWDEDESETEVEFLKSPTAFIRGKTRKMVFGSHEGNFIAEGMESLEFNLQDASYLEDPEEFIGNIVKQRRRGQCLTSSIQNCCLGCYHGILGCIGMLLDCCNPKCRKFALIVFVLALLGGGIVKLVSNGTLDELELASGGDTTEPINVNNGGTVDHTVSSVHDKTTHGSDRYSAMRQMVLHLGVVGPGTLDLANTPHHNALHWLSDHDESHIDIDNPGFLSRYVLALLYFSTKGQDSPNDGTASTEFMNWMTYKGACSWHGIRCQGGTVDSNGHGIVELIELPELYIGGSIPMELHALKGLERLDLSSNDLTGRIPENLLTMPRLTSLQLANNSLEGSLPNVITADCQLMTLNVEGSK